jgi:hypothetical protein
MCIGKVVEFDDMRARETHLMDVTSQPLATADLHILDPKNPLPPQTTSFFVAAMLNWKNWSFPGAVIVMGTKSRHVVNISEA